jgi:hypothetical protein
VQGRRPHICGTHVLSEQGLANCSSGAHRSKLTAGMRLLKRQRSATQPIVLRDSRKAAAAFFP